MPPGALNAALDRRVLAWGDDGALERAEFWRRVNGLATAIARHPARRWALVCEDGGWFAAGFFALGCNGRTIVLPQAPQAGSLAAAGVEIDAVLTDRPGQFPGLAVLPVAAIPADSSAAERLPDDALRVEFYTSGSTGKPKCVPKAYAQLRLEVEALEREWGATLGDAAVVGTVPHYHLYGLLFRILWPILSGRAFMTGICLQPVALRAAAARGRCVVVSSPAFLSRISDYASLPPPGQVAAVFSSGAPLPDAAAEKLAKDWGRAPIEVYGSTETGGIAWRAWSGAAERAWWQPIQGVATELRESDAGAMLWVRSGCTWQGDWMATGDLAWGRDDGRFTLRGRGDEVLKFEDKRVSLAEMRARLLLHEWVQDARLLLLPGRRSLIGAVVVLNPVGRAELEGAGRRAVREALRAWLRASYEALLIPRKWRFVDELPGNEMGKVELARLQALFEAGA